MNRFKFNDRPRPLGTFATKPKSLIDIDNMQLHGVFGGESIRNGTLTDG